MPVNDLDERPPVGVAHVTLYTNRIDESAAFMQTIGMRTIHEGSEVCVFEMRGGTHLILIRQNEALSGDASFDLMVDNLHATHEHFTSIGLEPTPVEAVPQIDHETFTVREPAGNVITFYSNHASGRPV